jgi:signal transduction histidine kinase
MNALLSRLMRAHEVKTKPVEETRFALRPLVNHIVKEVQLIDTSVKIEVAIPDHLMLYTDHALTHIMLENLLENAMQYQRQDEESKKVRITAKMVERSQLSLVVEDNGIGIPVEVADQVFEMFVVGSSQSKGAGLGLYEASVIADRLNGKVWLKEYGVHKTIFEVMLPVGG